MIDRRHILKALSALPLLSMPQFRTPVQAAALPTDGPILSKYGANASNGVDAYRPRQFATNLVLRDIQRDQPGVSAAWKITNAGAYTGWDIFAFGGIGGGLSAEVTPTWATFTLDRPATIAYVNRENVAPSWLAADGWVASGTVISQIQDARNWVDTRTVYRKSFPAGTATIKSPSESGAPKILPWILFAEADGTPSAAPSVPAGKTVPQPNQTCPTWVHDQYKAPNSTWPTWHPPVDPKYWCYFGDTNLGGAHEHGSNPALVYGTAGSIRFGEVAAQMGMAENHWGHKIYAVQFETVDALFVHHFGTFSLGRVNTCAQQRHLVEVHIRNKAHTETLYVVRFLADYGRSLGMKIQDQSEGPIDPSICPNGNTATGYTGVTPSRQIPVVPFGFNPACPTCNSYEPWVFVENHYLDTLGIGGNFVFNTVDGLTIPSDMSGNVATEVLTRSGTGRFFTPNTMSFHAPNLPATQRNAAGYWYTDATGLIVYNLDSIPANAVRQFCKPGWTGFDTIPNKLPDGTPNPESGHRGGPDMTQWGGWTTIVPTGNPRDFENAITRAHGPN